MMALGDMAESAVSYAKAVVNIECCSLQYRCGGEDERFRSLQTDGARHWPAAGISLYRQARPRMQLSLFSMFFF